MIRLTIKSGSVETVFKRARKSTEDFLPPPSTEIANPLMNKSLTVFTDVITTPEFDRPRPDRLASGNPNRTTWNHYESSGVSAGLWECEVGSWRIAFANDKDEFFHVLEGRIRITDEAGISKEFGPGDACVIPGGFSGLFEVVEQVKKHYVFVERNKFSPNN